MSCFAPAICFVLDDGFGWSTVSWMKITARSKAYASMSFYGARATVRTIARRPVALSLVSGEASVAALLYFPIVGEVAGVPWL